MNNLLTQKFPITAFALLFVLTLSCSHDPHDENQDPSNTDVHEWEDSTLSGDAVMGSAMTFKVGGGMSVERTAQTRVTTDIDGIATFTEGDLVAVAVTRSGGSEVIKLYQVKSDGSLEYAGGDNDPFVWKSTTEQVTIRAWSYGTSTNLSYTLTAPETFDYTLETDQQTNGYRELLYCKADDKSYSGGTISLTFYHQLARVVFNVTHELSGTLSVTSNSVGNTTSFPVTARFAVPTGSSNVGTWTTRSLYNTITPKTETTQSGYEKTYSAVVFPTTYAANTNFFTVTNAAGNYVYKSTGATLTGGSQYNYTINVKDAEIGPSLNPLWYVAPYNMLSATTMATAENAGYLYTWSNAVSTFGAQSTSYNVYKCAGKSISGQSGKWHLPTQYEWQCIVPGYVYDSTSKTLRDYDSGSGTYMASNLTVVFGYNEATRSGISEASYWKKINSNEIHAIRFLGTPYCSAWKYIWSGSKLTIYATLISQVANNASAAATFYNNSFSSVTFGDNGTTAVCRTFYGTGFSQNGEGAASSATHKGGAQLWSTTATTTGGSAGVSSYLLCCTESRLNIEPGSYSFTRPVRLFRDYK